ncbi:MBOAT family O-acyltransferase [Parablautia muri]|uniref:MBOAT family protein n=1 Tax=Parablautia muri TaxID=2320879 RepID=A0A9X5BF60_9FIRM|nr:MBOAT family O-acyltransferase [Parablautia muri]NBJ92676.1 MBOAT family protein [Parablautia muri]
MGYLSFNSLPFIVFLIVVISIYYVYPEKCRWVILLISSVMFYSFAGIEMLPFIISTSVIVWYASYKIDCVYKEADSLAEEKQLKGKEKALMMAPFRRKCRKRFLIPALIVVVGLLCYCKFAKMLVEGIVELAGGGEISMKVIFPLGISYYTFSTIGYLLDVYWGGQKYIKNYFKFALCVFYFPQIVEGPISKYSRLILEFEKKHPFDFKKICFGIQLMLYGYFKKMVIADRLVLFTSEVYGNIESYEGLTILIAMIFRLFYMYMDFSGCMDIVLGVSQMFGVELDKNFNHPFFSKSLAEYWRRWHITLGTWFRDYIYLPLLTSQWLKKCLIGIKNKFGIKIAKYAGTAIALMAVWILTGIWHGTGWNYVIWGIYNGTIIVISSFSSNLYKRVSMKLHIDTESTGYQRFQMLRTFVVRLSANLFLAANTLEGFNIFLKQLFKRFNPWILWDGSLYKMGLDHKDFCVVFLGLLFVWRISILQEQGSVREKIANYNIVLRWGIYYIAIFSIIILGMYGIGYDASAFVYAQF